MTSSTLTHPKRFCGRPNDDDAADVVVSLVVIEGPGRKESFLLGADRPPRVYLGQSASCELRIADDASVSRRHAAIDISRTHLTITDVDSKNGVFVNGVAVMCARLRGNEVIRIGDTKLRVVVEGAALTPTTESWTSNAEKSHFGRVWGESVEMRRIFALATRLAALDDLPILIEGESGTGKDLLAEAIHEASARSCGPFVVLDAACANEDATSIATSLFGDGAALGLIEQADGGTLLIDDISRIDLPTQARLLRLLDRSEIRRVSNAATPTNVRIIAATRRNIDRDVESGVFREELLLRFAAGRIELPPLRRRDGDAAFLLERIWSSLGGSAESTPYDLVGEHDWPGNVRELESAAVRRMIAPPSSSSSSSPPAARARSSAGDVVDGILDRNLPLPLARDQVVQDFERRYLERALVRANGNVVRAASAAGVARRYFQVLRARHLPKR